MTIRLDCLWQNKLRRTLLYFNSAYLIIDLKLRVEIDSFSKLMNVEGHFFFEDPSGRQKAQQQGQQTSDKAIRPKWQE